MASSREQNQKIEERDPREQRRNLFVSDSLNKVNLSSSPVAIVVLCFQTDVESRNSLQGVLQSQTLQTSVTDLEDQIRRTATSIFNQLEITEKSLRIGLEDQRQHKIALHQIRTSLDEDHVNGRALNNRVQAVEVLLKEIRDGQQVQAHSLQGVERNMIKFHEPDEGLFQQPRAIEAGLTQPLERYRPQNDLFPDIEERQRHPNSNSTMNVPDRSLGQSERYGQPSFNPPTSRNQVTHLFSSRSESSSNTIPMKSARKSCDLACGCVCHQRSQFKSPRSLNALLGSLFVGYQASPWSTQTCSNSDCRQRSKKFTYVYTFPQWFLARILLVDMAYSQSRGPELCLRVMRVRPMYAGGFQVICRGLTGMSSIHHLKRLFNDGEVSVLDVDTEHSTILHVISMLYLGHSVSQLTLCQQRAFMHRDLDAAEFLIRCGAGLYHEDDWGR